MWSSILLMSTVVACVAAHGRVFEPPSRSSAWRFGFPTPADYDDDGANCGGYAVQHSTNGGKCGICGDAYNIPPPRPHELGGMYGTGVIVAHYLPGSLMTTTVDLTTSHRGFWEFKLCPDSQSNDQECFDRHILATEDGETKYYPTQGSTKYNVTYRLPSGLVCDHCVLQWRYTAGNNWGICANGSSGLGCGSQEQFGACSDISIGMSKSMLRDGPESDDIPPPLMYYLKNGYFDAQQGVLHLLRGTLRPNSGVSNRNSVQNQQRPKINQQQFIQSKQANQQKTTVSSQQQPTQTNLQRPVQTNQQQPKQQPKLSNQQQPTQTNQHPSKSTQQAHPNQITSHNSRPNIQTSQKLVQIPQIQQVKTSQSGQQNQQLIKSQKIIVQHNQQSNQNNQQSNNNHQQSNHNHQQSNHNHQSHPGRPISQNQNTSLISQLDTLIQKHRDYQKQLKQQKQSQKSHSQKGQNPNRPHTIQITTTHSVHSYTVPQIHHVPHGSLKQWKNGKSARYKKNKKQHKGKKKPRKKKKVPFDDYNRIIKVGTW